MELGFSSNKKDGAIGFKPKIHCPLILWNKPIDSTALVVEETQ